MATPTHLSQLMLCLLVLSLGLTPAAAAINPSGSPSTAAAVDQPLDLTQVIALLREQQQEMAKQRKLLEAQSGQIAGLKKELKILKAPAQANQQVAATPAIESQVVTAQDLQNDSAAKPGKTRTQKAVETEASVVKAQQDDPTRDLLADFSGAWQLPGTSAALGIGGYVKTSVVYNQDPLEIKDRFIVGSIPVANSALDDIEAQSSITASQSRLNFDMREATDYGILRAFIEGDFAGDGETFRLRHAFGQWQHVLAGKTWSAFVDTDASPEEVDFEGLNGRVNVRQSQVRFMPRYGADYEFQLSLEDPNPQIQNGSGVTRIPDIVASGRFQPHDRLHLKVGVLARQIRAQQDFGQGGGVDKAYAWGLTVSGRFTTPLLDKRDSLLFQLNGGNGIGRYINDLSSVGNYDGILNPDDGDLELFDVLAGYASWQHWWRGDLRSNFTVGMVHVDNPGFVENDAYKRTVRLSSNLIWTPTTNLNIGLEYLWGLRENEDGEDGDATQIQMSAQYDF
jgi:hypothetical protein